MISVRQTSLDLFRSYRLTIWFGNPGSSELTLLEDFPDDFRYVLGLQETVPVGMADAYAQITRRPAVVNVHTAPGMGNAQGALYNAFVNKTPLIVTAGNQRSACCSTTHSVGYARSVGSQSLAYVSVMANYRGTHTTTVAQVRAMCAIPPTACATYLLILREAQGHDSGLFLRPHLDPGAHPACRSRSCP